MASHIYENGKRTYIRGSRTDEDRAYAKEWARKKRADPEVRKQLSKNTREYQKRHPIKYGFHNDSASAAKRGYEWDLTKEDYGRLIFSDCVYCGKAPSPINGIDRIDNTKGYTVENSASACFQCNSAKGTLTMKEFTEWADRFVRFRANSG